METLREFNNILKQFRQFNLKRNSSYFFSFNWANMIINWKYHDSVFKCLMKTYYKVRKSFRINSNRISNRQSNITVRIVRTLFLSHSRWLLLRTLRIVKCSILLVTDAFEYLFIIYAGIFIRIQSLINIRPVFFLFFPQITRIYSIQ